MTAELSQHDDAQGEAKEGTSEESKPVDEAEARRARAFSRLQKTMGRKGTLAKMVKEGAELEKESASSIKNEGEEDEGGDGTESHAGDERGCHDDEEAGDEPEEEPDVRTIEEKEAQLQVLIAQQATTDNGFGDSRNSVALQMQRAAKRIQREWRAHKKRVYWVQISALLGGEDGKEAFGRNEWGGFTMFNDPFAKPVEPEAELCTLPEYYSGSEYGDLSGEDLSVGNREEEGEEEEEEEDELEILDGDLEEAEQELRALNVEVDAAAVRRKAKRKARRRKKKKARMAKEAGEKPETTASSRGSPTPSHQGTPSKKKPPPCERPKLTETRVKNVTFNKRQQPSGEALPAVQQLTPFQILQRASSIKQAAAAAGGGKVTSSSLPDELQPKPPLAAGITKNPNRRKMTIHHPLPNREAKSKLMDWQRDPEHSTPKFKSPASAANRPLRDPGVPGGGINPSVKHRIAAVEKPPETPKYKAIKKVWEMLDQLVKQTPTVPTVLKPFSVAELSKWTTLMKFRFALLTKSVRELLEAGALDGKTKESVEIWFAESPLKAIEGLEQEIMAGHDGAKDGDQLISRIQMAFINTQVLGFKTWVQSLQDLLIVGQSMKIHGSESNVQAAGQLSLAKLMRLETKSTFVLSQYRKHQAIDSGVAAAAPGMMAEPFPPHRPFHDAPSNSTLLPSLGEVHNRKAKDFAANAPLDTRNNQEPMNSHQSQHAFRQHLPPIANPKRSRLQSEPGSNPQVPRANPDKVRRSLGSRQQQHQAASARSSEGDAFGRLAVCGPKGGGTPSQPQVKRPPKNMNQRIIKSRNTRRASTTKQ